VKVYIQVYNQNQTAKDKVICDLLQNLIDQEWIEAASKIWHAHSVWFLDGNPVVDYSKEKPGIRWMFWSGADFDEQGLGVKGNKFKEASVFFNESDQIIAEDLIRWLKKSLDIQWDYKNLIKRKGKLEKLK
jgi:hypothetical protein